MNSIARYCSFVVLVGLCAASSRAKAQIWLVEYTSSISTDKVSLAKVGVHRDGPSYVYTTGQLIFGHVTAVNIPGDSRTVVLSPDGYPPTGAPDAFLSDTVLNSGMLEPGLGDGNFQPGDEFTEYTFNQPVVNGPGPDLFLSFITFDFGTFESPPGPYWLMPNGGSPTQIDRAADQDLSTVESIPYFAYLSGGPTDPSDFLATDVLFTGSLGNENAHPRPSLQSIDLTELGIKPGGSMLSLRIWDDNFSNGNSIYPTMIAAFPVPEPSTAALAMLGSALGVGYLLRRRK